jgi:hypothetical protein
MGVSPVHHADETARATMANLLTFAQLKDKSAHHDGLHPTASISRLRGSLKSNLPTLPLPRHYFFRLSSQGCSGTESGFSLAQSGVGNQRIELTRG